MRKLEFSGSIFLLLFSLIACREAYRVSLGIPKSPGPGLFPFLLAAILFILSGFYFFKTLKALLKEEEIHVWKGLRWGKVILVFVLLLSYALFLEKVGFLLCTSLLLMSLFRWVDKQKWYWVYAGSLGITLVCYMIFKIWLKIQRPMGPIRI